MPIFIEISKRDLKRIFYSLKDKLDVKNFDSVAAYLDISRPMLFNYLSKKYLLPKELFKRISEKSGVKIGRYKEIKKDKFISKDIKNPILNEDLAEILGVLSGDGHISNNLYEIVITGNKELDREYFDYILKKIGRVFELKFQKSFHEHFIRIRGHSKQLALILTNRFDLPSGKKKGKMKIPECIINSRKLLPAYIRGLFDTDGTIYVRRGDEPVIEISSADKFYLESVLSILKLLGFKFGLGNNKIYLYNADEIKRFFRVIKPANPKHLKKYIEYTK